MNDNKNTILAIVLSALVLIGWEYFFAVPQEKARQQALQQQSTQTIQPPGNTTQPTQPEQNAPSVPEQTPQTLTPASVSRADALANSPRVAILTDSLKGSIALKGGRIDDLALIKYRETVDPNSPPVELLSPSGAPHPFYAEFGWSGPAGTSLKLPNGNTLWQQEGTGALGVGQPVTLTYDNGEGLQFRRTISVDDKYLFTVKDQLTNKGKNAISLFPYALVSRHGTPETAGYTVLHEGPIGVLGDKCLRQSGFSITVECHQESYKTLEEKKSISVEVKNAWLGFTDKYWSAILLPHTNINLKAEFRFEALGNLKTYQADYLQSAETIAPNTTGAAEARLFAGPREVRTVDYYDKTLRLNRFELLIDWGLFYFITKPMFWSLDYIYRFVGNFGVAILIVTVLIKAAFFPLANKSYASMAKMKAVQPQMTALRARYPDDKVKQQQELMALYKKEKINPLAGCLPIIIQIPVFFSLYKVLFVTIEMRHAPFFGWIQDLSAADPTNLFNLFGAIPIDPTIVPVIGHFLHLGAWPLIMGVTMWVQMKLNPTPPDPAQAVIFNWMPVIFTFMLASFPAGLVIYWAWNNLLSVIQQSIIMQKHGAKNELFENIKALFRGSSSSSAS
jgi:YidC/Oxa1 family membrane protein insertase